VTPTPKTIGIIMAIRENVMKYMFIVIHNSSKKCLVFDQAYFCVVVSSLIA